MPLTQKQMLEQMQEARANHQEMKALRALILNYAEHCLKTYPDNSQLCESMSALSYTIRARPIPDDRITFMNERYYTRFAKRNAKAKQRQTLLRAGLLQPRAAGVARRLAGPAPIFPQEHPDDAPLEFDSLPDATTPASECQQEKLSTSLDISLDPSE